MDTSTLLPKLKTNWASLEKKVRAFTYTDWYLILVCLIVFTAWVSKCAPFGFAGLILLSCFVLLTADDILPLTVNIFAAVLMIYSNKLADYLYLWPFFIPLALSIGVFAIRNFKKQFHFGKMFFPQAAVAFALLFGGIGIVSAADYTRALPTVLFLGIGVLAVYVLYNMYLRTDDKRDVALFFAKTMMYIGIVVCLELLVVIAKSNVAPANWNLTYWDVGWGNRNNIATYLLFTAPMTLYLATRYKQCWLYMLIGLAQYACLIMTFSRGGIIFGAIGGVFALVFTIIKAPDRKRMLISWGVVFAAALIAYFCVMHKVNDMIGSLIARGMGTSGRDVLYKEAWSLFKQHPFQGVGMGYMGTGPCPISEMNMYLFHSTFFHVLADMGLVGLLCYGYYYVMRCIILFKDIKNKFNLFMLVVWIGFEGYSMIDTGTIVPFPNMILIIIGVLLLEKLAGNRNFEGFADEYNSTIAYTKGLFKKGTPAVADEAAISDVADVSETAVAPVDSDCAVEVQDTDVNDTDISVTDVKDTDVKK